MHRGHNLYGVHNNNNYTIFQKYLFLIQSVSLQVSLQEGMKAC